MARLTGPDEACRVVYLTSGTNKGKAAAQGMSAPVYTDLALTTLANILSTTGDVIAESTVTVDAYSRIPLFQYPDGVDTVYTSVNGGPAVALYARTDDRIDALTTALSAATGTANSAAQKSANLSDLASAPTARTNLGLGGAATLSVGTSAGTVAAADDSRITGAAQQSSNLSDLANAATARTNLGLGTSATRAVGTTTGTVAAGDDSRIVGALPTSGGSLTGDLIIQSTTSAQRRIETTSYFETDGLGTSETIRLHFARPAGLIGNPAKNAIAWFDDDISTTTSQVWVQAHNYLHWYNPFTGAATAVNTATDRITATAHGLPSTPTAWRGQFTTTGTLPGGLSLATSYYAKRIDANTVEIYTDAAASSKVDLTSQGTGNHTFTPDNTFFNNQHRHFSVEVSNADLANKNTRFSIPWGYDTTEVGFFQSNVNVNDGTLRINGSAGSFRQLQFGGTLSDNLVPDGTSIRWSVQANSTAESGSNAGSDFRIVRYSDIGVALDAPVTVKRSTGYVGINVGSNTPAARLDVQTDGTIEGAFVKATAAGTANVAVFRLESFATGKRVFDYRVTGDGVSRFRLDTSAGSGSGTLTFGDGTTADTNLYRSAATTLKTDTSFHVGADFRHLGSNVGFYNTAAAAKQAVTGSRGGNAALASLLTALATVGLITDSSTA